MITSGDGTSSRSGTCIPAPGILGYLSVTKMKILYIRWVVYSRMYIARFIHVCSALYTIFLLSLVMVVLPHSLTDISCFLLSLRNVKALVRVLPAKNHFSNSERS